MGFNLAFQGLICNCNLLSWCQMSWRWPYFGRNVCAVIWIDINANKYLCCWILSATFSQFVSLFVCGSSKPDYICLLGIRVQNTRWWILFNSSVHFLDDVDTEGNLKYLPKRHQLYTKLQGVIFHKEESWNFIKSRKEHVFQEM